MTTRSRLLKHWNYHHWPYSMRIMTQISTKLRKTFLTSWAYQSNTKFQIFFLGKHIYITFITMNGKQHLKWWKSLSATKYGNCWVGMTNHDVCTGTLLVHFFLGLNKEKIKSVILTLFEFVLVFCSSRLNLDVDFIRSVFYLLGWRKKWKAKVRR